VRRKMSVRVCLGVALMRRRAIERGDLQRHMTGQLEGVGPHPTGPDLLSIAESAGEPPRCSPSTS